MKEPTSFEPPLWWLILMAPLLFALLIWEVVSGRKNIETIYTEYNEDGTLKHMWAVNHKGEVRELC